MGPADDWRWIVVQVWASTGLSPGEEVFHLASEDLAEVGDELSWRVAHWMSPSFGLLLDIYYRYSCLSSAAFVPRYEVYSIVLANVSGISHLRCYLLERFQPSSWY